MGTDGSRLSTLQQELSDFWEECFGDRPEGADEQEKVIHLQEAFERWKNERHYHLPRTLELMRLKLTQPLEYHREGRSSESLEKVLLVTWGFSSEQLALSIAVHQPHLYGMRVVAFTSEKAWERTIDDVQECLALLDIDPGVIDQEPQIVESNDPTDVFRKIVTWLREHPNVAPAMDCTGGQKPMDSGATYAASFYDVPAYYLDFEDYDLDVRRPQPWTSRYHKMTLPDAAFSFQSRSKIRSDFLSHQYSFALEEIEQLRKRSESSEYLDQIDKDHLVQAETLIARAERWMNVQYDSELFEDHKLHGTFRVYVESKEEFAARKLVEWLLFPKETEDRELLLEYVIDEYWRIWLQREAGDHRGALIGSAGLVELIVDALFRYDWFNRSAKIKAAFPSGSRRREDRIDALTGAPFDFRQLPDGRLGNKVKLLRGSEASFEVWIEKAGGNIIDRRDVNFKHLDKYLELFLRVECDPLLRSGKRGISRKSWEKFGGNLPYGQWYLERHGLVHIRAPLRDQSLVNQALDTYVRNFIELLFRLEKRGGRLELEQAINSDLVGSWVTWHGTEGYRLKDRAPWLTDENRRHLADWLRLPEGSRTKIGKEES